MDGSDFGWLVALGLWLALAAVWLGFTRRLSCWPPSAKDYLWPWLPLLVVALAWGVWGAETASLFATLALVFWIILSAVWMASVARRDSSIMDIAYAASSVVAAWVQWRLQGADASPRTLLALALVNLWGWRYTIYIALRNLPHGEDARYARWRSRTGEAWWWWSYFQVFLVQGVMIWLWYLPLALALAVPGPIGALEVAAALVWTIGFVFEAGADWQLARFKRDPANRGKIIATGLWAQSRHPNYFGEAAMWCGYGLLALAHPWGWVALACTAYTVHLMNRGSATRMTDAYLMKRKPGYREYAARTPIFLPRIFGGRPERP